MSVHALSKPLAGRGRPLTRPPDAVLLELHEAGWDYHALAARFDRLPITIETACEKGAEGEGGDRCLSCSSAT
jgi:hypothetical protein